MHPLASIAAMVDSAKNSVESKGESMGLLSLDPWCNVAPLSGAEEGTGAAHHTYVDWLSRAYVATEEGLCACVGGSRCPLVSLLKHMV